MNVLSRFRAAMSAFKNPAPTANSMMETGESLWWSKGSTFNEHTTSGETITSENVLTSTTCFACTKLLSECVAGLPSSIVKQMKRRRRETVESHRAIDLLCEMPNPEMNSYTFWELAVTRFVNSGNFWAEIQRDGADRPIALWPIHPSRVRPVRMDDGSLYWEVSSDDSSAEWSDPSPRPGQNVTLIPDRNMLNVVGFGSSNGIIGPGIAPGAQEIGIEKASQRYGATYFANGGMPLGFVKHPRFFNEPEKRATFREDINQMANRRGKIGVLWDGAEYQAIGLTPEQVQMLESRRFSTEQICSLYGVSPALVGHMRDSKFANAGEATLQFVMFTLRNLVERIERATNTQVMKTRVPGRLVSAFNDNTIFKMALDGILRGDPKLKADVHDKYRFMGILTTNDILRDLDLNEIDGPEGEYRLVHSGTSRLETIDQQGNRGGVTNPAPTEPQKSAYNRDALISALEELAHTHKTSAQVRGAALEEDKPEPEPTEQPVNATEIVKEAIQSVAESAINRINEITATQIERWREKDPKEVETKVSKFFDQQASRLGEALSPIDAMALKVGIEPKTEIVLNEYKRITQSLDSYSVFDARLSQPKVQLCQILS